MTERLIENKIKKIIIEGPDCSGKSTLVERLKNRLRWDSKYLRHKSGNQYLRYIKEYCETEIIFDRAHFSENVYSTMWRNGKAFTLNELNILNEMMSIDTLIIFAIPDTVNIKKRYMERGFKQQISLDELEYSRDLFIEESKKVKCLIYKSKDFNELELLLNKVEGMVNETICNTR